MSPAYRIRKVGAHWWFVYAYDYATARYSWMAGFQTWREAMRWVLS